MTYDERRQDVPNNPPYQRSPQRNGYMWILGAVALLIIGGFALLTMGRDAGTASRPERPVTTGAGSSTPAPATRDMGTGIRSPTANTPTPAPKQ